MSSHVIARIKDVRKIYRMGTVEVEVLRGVSLDFYSGEYISIMGPSGCGKSTMLNLLGCLDRPTHGSYILDGQDVSTIEDDELSAIRGRKLGFIFQSYNLIQQLSVLENIEVPLFYQGRPEEESRAIAIDLAKLVGLESRMHHKPFELSGGQQQRVGIARSLANDPVVLLADEPTGNLDSTSGKDILKIFADLHARGKTIIMVTHDTGIGQLTTRCVRFSDGKVESDVRR
ncbi:MAG: transporter ATP-binding protein [Verrucomicrobiales bacterium]|nr:transporter ATP-binding protein [Verrucomicrobiales bacterium]